MRSFICLALPFFVLPGGGHCGSVVSELDDCTRSRCKHTIEFSADKTSWVTKFQSTTPVNKFGTDVRRLCALALWAPSLPQAGETCDLRQPVCPSACFRCTPVHLGAEVYTLCLKSCLYKKSLYHQYCACVATILTCTHAAQCD